MAKTTDIAKTATDQALVRPDFIKAGDKTGTEHITRDDIQMPRLALAQSMSPQLDPSHSLYLEDLKVGYLFNSVTGENFKTGPMEFFILRADPPRYVEFIPREQGGGVKDPNVPANDPRTQFTVDDEGTPVPPLATKFYDFIALLLPWNEADPMSRYIALSFKSTGLKVARQLNTLIQFRNAPLYTGKYSIDTVDEKNAKGAFKNFRVKNAGWVANPEQAEALRKMYEDLKEKTITVDREGAGHDGPDGEGDTSFNPSNM